MQNIEGGFPLLPAQAQRLPLGGHALGSKSPVMSLPGDLGQTVVNYLENQRGFSLT